MKKSVQLVLKVHHMDGTVSRVEAPLSEEFLRDEPRNVGLYIQRLLRTLDDQSAPR